MWTGSSLVTFAIFIVVLIVVVKAIRVVPQQHAWVVERLGRFHARARSRASTSSMPFVDRVAYRHDLREIPLDVPQPGLHHQGQHAAAGRRHPVLPGDRSAARVVRLDRTTSLAITQLAQTTLRSVIGKMELDRTFEERDQINAPVVAALDEAARELGRQGAALRDQGPDAAGGDPARDAGADHRRAREARGDRDVRGPAARSRSTSRTGAREAAIAKSEGEKQAEINKAQGEAAAILVDRRGEREGDPAGRPKRSQSPGGIRR